METRTLRRLSLAVALIWMGCTSVYLYPDVKGQFEEKAFFGRAAEQERPVIPLPCFRARGVENDDFVREDKDPAKCWVGLASFRRLYPEIAATTDIEATVRLNARDRLPMEQWDAAPLGAILNAAAVVAGLPAFLLLLELLRSQGVLQRSRRTVQPRLLGPEPVMIRS
jgi:hypothetical protein